MANADALLLSVSADIRQLQKQMDKAQGIVSTSSRRMVKTIDAANENIGQKLGRGFGTAIGNNIRNLSGQLGSATTAFESFGAAGIGAAAGVAVALGALTIAARQAEAALVLGDAIADDAQQIGVSTDLLQEYQYAIAQTGGEAKDAAEAIGSFTKVLGAAQSGLSPKALKGFAALGFSKEELKAFPSVEAALTAVAAKISTLGKESERAAAATKVGLGAMIPAIRAGADEFDRLRKAAHDLGYVLDEETVKALGDLKDKSDAASQVLKVQLAQAFSGVASAIVGAKLALADLLIEFNKLGSNPTARAIMNGALGAAASFVPGGNVALAAARALNGRSQTPRVSTSDLQNAFKNGIKPVTPAIIPGGGDSLIDTSTTRGGGGRDNAASDAKARAARQARVEEDIYRASLEEFDIYNGERRSIEERAQFALDRLDIEQKHRAAELDQLEKDYAISAGKEGISKAERERLEISEAAVLSGRKLNVREEAALDLADQRLRYEQDLRSLSLDVLGIAESMATTQAERRKIQLEIIASEREIARKALAESLDRNPNLTPEQRGVQLGAFDAGTAGLKDSAVANTRGPLEDYFASLPNTIAEMDEAMEAFAANGIGSVVDGLADAVTGARSLKDVFKNVVASMLADITRLNLQRALGGAFANFGGGNLASIASSTIASNPMLFAEGTDNAPGGMAWVGEKGPELMNVPKGAQIIPNDILRSMARSPASAPSAGKAAPAMHFHFSGSVTGAEARRTGRQAAAAFQRQVSGAKRVGY